MSLLSHIRDEMYPAGDPLDLIIAGNKNLRDALTPEAYEALMERLLEEPLSLNNLGLASSRQLATADLVINISLPRRDDSFAQLWVRQGKKRQGDLNHQFKIVELDSLTRITDEPTGYEHIWEQPNESGN